MCVAEMTFEEHGVQVSAMVVAPTLLVFSHVNHPPAEAVAGVLILGKCAYGATRST